MNAKGHASCNGVDEWNVLRYGIYIVDEMYDTWDMHTYRLRAVRYNGKLYWHKMVDGRLVEFRSLR